MQNELDYMKYCKNAVEKKPTPQFTSDEPTKTSEEPPQDKHKKIKETEKKQERLKLNKKAIIIGTLIVLSIIVGIMSFFAVSSITSGFNYIDAITSNSTGLPSTIYYGGNPLFVLSGWESKLEYNNITDRLVGNQEYRKIIFDDKGKAYTVTYSENQVVLEPLTKNPEIASKVGWFTNLGETSITQKKSWNQKTIKIDLSDPDSEIGKSELGYTFYKEKPYFKIQFSTEAEDSLKLGNFAYGIVLNNYEIYLPNGTILENDNKLVRLDKPVSIVVKEGGKNSIEAPSDIQDSVLKTLDTPKNIILREGSTYDINESYQVFYNKKKDLAIITYSPETLYFKDSFYWNVYWVYVPHNQGYPPLYFIVAEHPKLKYEEGDWHISIKEYEGDVKSYIGIVVNKIGTEK